MSRPLELLGAPGSPYSRKLIALLRYRQIPHRVHWGMPTQMPENFPEPKVKLLPTVYFPIADGSFEARVDTTPIIRDLESSDSQRSVLPSDPVVRYLNDVIEDYADEWLTKAMFHYRWAHQEDRENAGPMIVFWHSTTLSDEDADAMSAAFTQRQFDRLYVVGSNAVTAETIESSYARFLTVLDKLLMRKGFVLGARPSSADFAIFGQLTQLAIVEPTPASVTRQLSMRVRAWLDRMDDLSGLPLDEDGWMSAEEALEATQDLLAEIGRVYVPFLQLNAAAAEAGEAQVTGQIDGRRWEQPTFPYQVKCLAALIESYAELPANAQELLAPALDAAGCGALAGDV